MHYFYYSSVAYVNNSEIIYIVLYSVLYSILNIPTPGSSTVKVAKYLFILKLLFKNLLSKIIEFITN